MALAHYCRQYFEDFVEYERIVKTHIKKHDHKETGNTNHNVSE